MDIALKIVDRLGSSRRRDELEIVAVEPWAEEIRNVGLSLGRGGGRRGGRAQQRDGQYAYSAHPPTPAHLKSSLLKGFARKRPLFLKAEFTSTRGGKSMREDGVQGMRNREIAVSSLGCGHLAFTLMRAERARRDAEIVRRHRAARHDHGHGLAFPYEKNVL